MLEDTCKLEAKGNLKNVNQRSHSNRNVKDVWNSKTKINLKIKVEGKTKLELWRAFTSRVVKELLSSKSKGNVQIGN